MDISTLQGLIASGIGILLFLMGYWKGTSDGVQGAVQSMFELGILAVDENDNVVPGPHISKVIIEK